MSRVDVAGATVADQRNGTLRFYRKVREPGNSSVPEIRLRADFADWYLPSWPGNRPDFMIQR